MTAVFVVGAFIEMAALDMACAISNAGTVHVVAVAVPVAGLGIDMGARVGIVVVVALVAVVYVGVVALVAVMHVGVAALVAVVVVAVVHVGVFIAVVAPVAVVHVGVVIVVVLTDVGLVIVNPDCHKDKSALPTAYI